MAAGRPALFPPSDGYLPPEDPLVGCARQIAAVAAVKKDFPRLQLVGTGYTYLQEWLPHVGQAVVRQGLADFVGLVGGMLVAVYERHIDLFLYWNTIFYWVVIRDLLTGLGKSFFFGVIVTLIGAYNGLGMTGGTEGLGRATTATVVQVSVAVIISDFFLTKLFLLL